MMKITLKIEDWPAIMAEIEASGMTAADIARAMDCPDSTVRSWQRGHRPQHHYGNGLLQLRDERRALIVKLNDTKPDMWGKKRA